METLDEAAAMKHNTTSSHFCMSLTEAFRQRVLVTARRLFPEFDFEAVPGDPDQIKAGNALLGLGNLKAKHDHGGQTDADFDQLVRHHFSLVLVKRTPTPDDFTLAQITPLLRPQIMPASFQNMTPVPLVSFPLAGGIRVGLVGDFPETYAYIREADLDRWKVDANELRRIALENLEGISGGLQIQGSDNGRNSLLVIAAGDGYDAARILLPSLQEVLAEHLGETFRFGIPNRDFLICWRTDCDREFHHTLAAQIAKDSNSRPYPLSPSVFVRNPEGNFHEQTPV